MSEAYDAAIASDCKSDLFWRVIDFTSGMSDEYTLECTRLNPGGYQNTVSQIHSSGIGSTVGYVGATGIVTYYPVNETYGADFQMMLTWLMIHTLDLIEETDMG